MDALDPANADRLLAAMEWIIAKDNRLKAMTDAELSAAVLDKVWANLPFHSEGELLLDEMISRFELAKGIRRNDENGEIIPDEPTSGTILAAEARAQCNDMTQDQRDAAFKRGMALINGETPPPTTPISP